MAGSYLEHFLESIQTLPCDLTRNLTLIQNLDSKVQAFVDSAQKLSEDYVQNVNEMQPDQKKSSFQTIMANMDKAQVFSEEKKELAHQIYNMVDKHIRRLDTELAKFDIDLDDDSKEASTSSTNTKRKRPKSNPKEKPVPKITDKSDSDDNHHQNSKKRNIENICSPNGNAKNRTAPKELQDMEVDPNEPLYCLCQQVSFGEMVGCDDTDCLLEWFHFACVGLTSKPKGKWYCPQCTMKRKNRQA